MPDKDAPTVEDILASANTVLEEHDFVLRAYGDGDLIANTFRDWDLICEAHGRPPDFGRPRALLKHRTGPWWLLAYAPSGGHRLLHPREYAPQKEFRFSADPKDGTTYLIGTDDDILAHATSKHRRGHWSTDVLLWFLDHMPGDNAEAERVMLAFWFTQQQTRPPRNQP